MEVPSARLVKYSSIVVSFSSPDGEQRKSRRPFVPQKAATIAREKDGEARLELRFSLHGLSSLLVPLSRAQPAGNGAVLA